MTSPAHPTSSNRRRTIILVVAAAVVIAAVVAAFVLGRSSNKKPTPAAATTTTPAPSAPATSGQAPLTVNGCLGGPDPSLAIGSVFNAPLTPEGAVEFTATLLRWLGDSTKDGGQATTIGPKVVAPALVPRIGASAAAGTTTKISTQDSIYSVQMTSNNSAVVQMLITYTTTTPTDTQTLQGGGSYVLGVKDGHWYLKDLPSPANAGDSRSTSEIQKIQKTGRPLPGGC